MSATINTAFTLKGLDIVSKYGVLNSIQYWAPSDNSHLYNVTASENIIPLINGTRPITTAFCGQGNYNGMFNSLTPQEVVNLTSRTLISFIKTNCADEFSVSSPHFVVNINSWIHELSNLVYSFDMDGLTKPIWNYLSGTVQKRNLTTSDFKSVTNITDFEKISYKFNTEEDFLNYQLISPLYVESNGGVSKVVDNSSNNQYPSPLLLSFTTAAINGSNFVNGTSGLLTLRPNGWFYWTDKGIQDIITVENNPGGYTWIYPATLIGSKYYYLPDNELFSAKSDYIGYLMKMVDTVDGTTTAIQGLINQLILFFKTKAQLQSDGTYRLRISMTAEITDTRINGSKINGNNLIIDFIYNETDNTSPIITKI